MTLLIQIVHRIGKRAERRVEAAYLNDLKRVAGKTRILYRIADAALEHPDEPVREVVFPIANEQTLRDLVAEYKAQGGAYRQQVQEIQAMAFAEIDHESVDLHEAINVGHLSQGGQK